jgi:N6-adenosine-specific RNA methylase IME4
MSKKFQVIVADPPWGNFKDNLKQSSVKRGASANYPTMSISDIKQLDVQSVCDSTGTVLCLWVPSCLLQEGLDTMRSWQFVHKQSFIWVKSKKHKFQNFIKWIKKSVLKRPQVSYDKFVYKRAINAVVDNLPQMDLNEETSFFMGRLFRQTHEICLIGINNNGVYKKLKNKSQRSVMFAENLKHSAKPELLQDRLELMFPDANFLEVFGRRSRSNWTVIGNESPTTLGEDIRISLANLCK